MVNPSDEELKKLFIRGQCSENSRKKDISYRSELNVNPESMTETLPLEPLGIVIASRGAPFFSVQENVWPKGYPCQCRLLNKWTLFLIELHQTCHHLHSTKWRFLLSVNGKKLASSSRLPHFLRLCSRSYCNWCFSRASTKVDLWCLEQWLNQLQPLEWS